MYDVDLYSLNYATFCRFEMGLEAVIKSAASAASRKTKSRGLRFREAPGQRLSNQKAAGRGASLDLGPWIWSSWRLR